MGNLTNINEFVGEAKAGLNEFIDDNKGILGYIGAGLGGAVIGGAAGYMVGKGSSKKKRTSSRKSKSKRRARRGMSGRSRDRKYISKQKHERYYAKTHPKRRKTGKYYKSRSKRVKYTKNGQPYILLSNGKARFVKKM